MDIGEHEAPVRVGANLQLGSFVEVGYGSTMMAPQGSSMPESIIPDTIIPETIIPETVVEPVIQVPSEAEVPRYLVDSETLQLILTEIKLVKESVGRIELMLTQKPVPWWKRLWRKYVNPS